MSHTEPYKPGALSVVPVRRPAVAKYFPGAIKAEWQEELHPRENDGKFAPKGEGVSSDTRKGEAFSEPRASAVPQETNRGRFSPAKTLDEAKKFTESLGVTVECKRTHLSVLNDVNAVLAAAKERGDPLPNAVEIMTKSNAPWAGRARFNPGTKKQTLVVNAGKGLGPEECQAEVDSGFWSQPNPIMHEMGHIWQAANHEGKFVTQFRLGAGVYGEDRKIAEKVSRYAAASRIEFVAETFAGLRSGKHYDDDVIDLFDKYAGGPLE